MKVNENLIDDFTAYYEYVGYLYREDRETPLTASEKKGHLELCDAINKVYNGVLDDVKRFMDNHKFIVENKDNLQLHQVEHYLEYYASVMENDDLGVCLIIVDPTMVVGMGRILAERKIDILQRREVIKNEK